MLVYCLWRGYASVLSMERLCYCIVYGEVMLVYCLWRGYASVLSMERLC